MDDRRFDNEYIACNLCTSVAENRLFNGGGSTRGVCTNVADDWWFVGAMLITVCTQMW